ncbi:MAG: MotA/TolQ/ExbB proton channel family protein [Gammaproteobacteria bacterium]|nr:MotA/TolQ/ExbB proton channel family protein [Gammaproteobacteria bacterium]
MYSEVLTHYQAGGWMIWPMVAITPLLWYALGYRYVIIKKGFSKHNVRTVIRAYEKSVAKNDNWNEKKSMIHTAVVTASDLKELKVVPIRPYLDEAFSGYLTETKKYSTLIRTIVYVAPLMGLLGTVTGMIETFDSLQDMTLHSASGGIAGGISQALITTQLGLTIAIPGLLINTFLDKRKERIERELNQLKDIICSQRKVSFN